MEDRGSIAALSRHCSRCFDNLLVALKESPAELHYQMSPQIISNELSRFKIWCGNLGALQKGRSSLDVRLRDSTVMRQTVLRFLTQLSSALKESLEIATGTRTPWDKLEHPVCDDMIGQAGNEDSEEDTTSDEDEDELTEKLSEIQDTVAHLFRLAFKIRNTTHRSRSSKALAIKKLDEETREDAFNTYASFDAQHALESLTQYRCGPRQLDSNSLPVRQADHQVPTFLVERLGAAITNRRRYFAYWQRHSLKLSHIVDEAPSSERTLIPQAIEGFRTAQTGPSHHDLLVGQHPSMMNLNLNVEATTVISGTEISKYRHSLDDALDAQTVISYATTAKDIDGRTADLPPPPPDAASQPEFVCPYCFVACPSRQGKGKPWRAHILQDLQPYVCTFPDCVDGDCLYDNREAWMEHERLCHMRIWRCFDSSHPDIFSSKEKLQAHFSQLHGDLSESQIATLVSLVETTHADTRDECPFCGSSGPFEKGLHNHMAFHQEQLATFAAPKNLDWDKDEETHSANAQGSRKSGSPTSIPLSFSDGSKSDGARSTALPGRVTNSEPKFTALSSTGEDGFATHDKVHFVPTDYDSEADMDWKDAFEPDPLYNAAARNDINAARTLLNQGANPSARGPDGYAITKAIHQGYVDMACLLLEAGAAGADPERPYTEPEALLAAAKCGHEKIVDLLFDSNVPLEDSNLRLVDLDNALKGASEAGHRHIVKILLQKGVDTYGNFQPASSALQAASSKGHVHVVELLLEYLKDGEPELEEYAETFSIAASQGHESILKMLLDHWVPFDTKSQLSSIAMAAACVTGKEHIVRLLLERGMDVNASIELYGSPLIAASFFGHDHVVKILLDAGAEVNCHGGEYGTALMAACWQGAAEQLCALLMDRGADVNAKGGIYGTALITAMKSGNRSLVNRIIQSGADLDDPGDEGHGSAIQVASRSGLEEILELLLDAGANPNGIREPRGRALYNASRYGHEGIVKRLIDAGADVNAEGGKHGYPLHAAIVTGHVAVAKQLIDAGADVNASSEKHGYPLQAASFVNSSVVPELLAAGAYVDGSAPGTSNALQIASFRGYEWIVVRLIDNNANIHSTAGPHGHALHAAAKSGHTKIVELLIDAGADLNEGKETMYIGAFRKAAKRGHTRVMEILYDKIGITNHEISGLESEMGEMLEIMNNYTLELIAQDRLGEAESISRRVVEGTGETLGRLHPQSLRMVARLASILERQKRLTDAVVLRRQVMYGFEESLEADDPVVTESVVDLASILSHLWQWGESEVLFRRALQWYDSHEGSELAEATRCANMLSYLLICQGRYLEAEQVSQDALVKWQPLVDNKDATLIPIMGNLADALNSQKKFEQAEEVLLKGIALAEDILGSNNEITLKMKIYLSRAYGGLGRLEEKEQLELLLLESSKMIIGLGNRDQMTLSVMKGLAETYESQGLLYKCMDMMTQVIQIQRRADGTDPKANKSTINEYAPALSPEERRKEMEEMEAKLIEMRQRLYGKD